MIVVKLISTSTNVLNISVEQTHSLLLSVHSRIDHNSFLYQVIIMCYIRNALYCINMKSDNLVR